MEINFINENEAKRFITIIETKMELETGEIKSVKEILYELWNDFYKKKIKQEVL